MKPDWAVENLQTIRTLMERSAVYRRALAPIMLLAGGMGVLAAALGYLCHWSEPRPFWVLWQTTAGLVLVGAYLIARRQAFQAAEPFWSPPTRRVSLAFWPPLAVGGVLGAWPLFQPAQADSDFLMSLICVGVWTLFYGVALHAAGFFTPRGIRWFGWGLMLVACAMFYGAVGRIQVIFYGDPNLFMGAIFGLLHLAYGIYLRFTERPQPAL